MLFFLMLYCFVNELIKRTQISHSLFGVQMIKKITIAKFCLSS